MQLHAGGRLGAYEILGPLGAGGMGMVWKARDPKLGRLVAIKVLKEDDPEDLARLVQEARAAAQLNHPNIVTVHEIGEQEGSTYIVMEFVDGRVLSEQIGKKGLSLKESLKYGLPVVRALEAAHRRGIIHRDLKPHNVMVTGEGEVKLLDFGLAKRIAPAEPVESQDRTATLMDRPNTARGQIVGTFAYMSPEQAQGQPVDARSDIFSFGILLYEMLTSRRPFEGHNTLSVLAAILREEPKPPSQVSAVALPPQAEHIVLRCLRKDPERRFQTASDLRAALEDLREELTSGKLDAVTLPPAARKLRWRPAAILAAAAGVLAFSGIWFFRSPKAIEPRVLHQVTFDGGIAATAAMSPDGKLLAFASDRAEPGNLDIWLRQTAGGGLMRLTAQPGAEYNPQFSPDGTKLYYLAGDLSIYEIPALGGPARKVTGHAGPFAVSGKGEIAFVRIGPAASPGPVSIVPAEGGAEEAWQPACRSAAAPAWSPDGSMLFFFGQCGEKLRGGFVAPRRGGEAKAVVDLPRSARWAAPVWFRLAGGPEGIVYASEVGEGVFNLFRFGLRGRPAPITSGANWQLWPAVSPGGAVVFTQAEKRTSIWSLAGGEAAPVVEAAGHFSVSRDGGTLVYGRLAGGSAGELVVRDQATGNEKVFAEHELLGVSIGSLWPQVAPGGKRILYRVVGAQGGHYLLRADTGEVRRVATMEHFQLASDWSADGKRVAGECPPPRFGICELDPESGAVRRLLVHATDQLLYPSPSWDGRSMVFMRRRPGGPAAIWIAPAGADGTPGPEKDWVGISPPDTDNSRPRFSPDGGAVYYVMGRGGQRLLVVQKIERGSHRPIGEPAALVRAPLEVTAVTGGAGPYPLIAVTEKHVFYSMVTLRGNLWMTRLE